MKNKEAFEKWFDENMDGRAYEMYDFEDMGFSWQACEEYYESKDKESIVKKIRQQALDEALAILEKVYVTIPMEERCQFSGAMQEISDLDKK